MFLSKIKSTCIVHLKEFLHRQSMMELDVVKIFDFIPTTLKSIHIRVFLFMDGVKEFILIMHAN